MQLVTIDGIDSASLVAAVGPQVFFRGLDYARQRAVRHMTWDEEEVCLRAMVRGSDGATYDTAVYFQPRLRGDLEFVFGECSCPVGMDCKHAAAVVLAATSTAVPTPVIGQPPRSWEQSLAALLDPPRGSPSPAGAGPLAIELSPQLPPPGAGNAVPKLLARLVRPGRNGWVGGSLSWSKLESRHQLTDCRAEQVRLLHELYLMYRAGSSTVPSYHYYGAREDKTIDLAELGVRLWSLLDEAAELGIELVHARKRLGPVGPYRQAAISLEITTGDDPGALVIAPVLRVPGGGEAVRPILFLGPDGHGVVYLPPNQNVLPDEGRFQLAKLDTAAPPALQRMVLSGQPLPVPAGQQDRFAHEFYPRLRQLARIESPDGSFTPPEISEPTLLLRADYGTEHELSLSWNWAYQVGGQQLQAPLAGPSAVDGYRDRAGERRVLDAVAALLGPFGPLADEASPEPARLSGLDTMRFSTEVLPLLTDAAGVAVEVAGAPPTYREAGDSLRIGVSTSEVAGETDWFDLGVTITVEGRPVPFSTVFAALARDESHLLLPDGAFFSLDKPELRDLRTLIEEARALQDGPPDALRISRFQAGLWAELAALGVVERQARAWRQQVTGLLELGGVNRTAAPAALQADLRPYQRDGYEWLCFLFRHRLGGILADDMGLGKTLQALAMICHAKQDHPGLDPFLIVAPTSVVANWASEAARFAPDLRVVTITDTLRRRGQDLSEIIAGADVVVTSYTLFRLDADAHAAVGWSGLILDEAQFAKNHQSKVYQCARRCPAPFKLAITGTPMENNLMELWSMLSIIAPGLFPNPTRFREHFARPIERQADAELLGRLRRRIKPLIKRRTKEQVAADLPAKQEQLLEVELDPRHRRIYQRHLQRERQKVLGLLHDVDRNRFTILRSLTMLRQLSLHPGLIEPEHRTLSSSKIDGLLEQLREVIDGGHRALVFSQFTGFLGLVRERLDTAGVAYSYLDGSTRNRPAVVQQFKDGAAPVFLISLKAGGFGLNLTEADYCFLLDPWWNPATETQAMDRTHRIGQTRNVMVYRLIAKDTIEEKVLALAGRKAKLSRSVLDEGGAFSSALGAADIRQLLA